MCINRAKVTIDTKLNKDFVCHRVRWSLTSVTLRLRRLCRQKRKDTLLFSHRAWQICFIRCLRCRSKVRVKVVKDVWPNFDLFGREIDLMVYACIFIVAQHIFEFFFIECEK